MIYEITLSWLDRMFRTYMLLGNMVHDIKRLTCPRARIRVCLILSFAIERVRQDINGQPRIEYRHAYNLINRVLVKRVFKIRLNSDFFT
jgi:hypothetical protein